ncbi:MAG TPA: ATP-dependent DNA ligase [Thermodesulfobacteriota bacterium]|nr:ATP-dependent DNA ligase [Thermodesulfobacteriota bacterium]
MLLKQLVEVSERVAATPRKKEKTSTLAAFLRQARGKEIALAAAYLSGQVPQGSLGIGWANIRASLSGSNAAGQPLTVIETDGIFELISEEKGAGSVGRKIGHLSSLFSRATEGERDFLIRLIIGEIRQGALEGLLLDAVAEASALSPGEIRQAQMFSGDTGEVARAALEEGAAGLSRFQPLLFRPVSPMLANPAEEEGEALERLGEAAWEYKIDGARIQIHKGGDEVRVYTRSLKDVTSSVPEVVALARNLPLDQAILEGEAVALRGDGRPLPFQVTMRRFGRIQDVERMQKEIPLAAYLFDLVYAQERPLFAAPYRERFDRLSRAVPSENLIPRIVSGKQGEIRDFLEKSVRAGHEGIMGKALASPYVAGQRGYLWLKIKPAQTLDLVVLAAEWGHGRRREWLSNLHLGARDPESGQFVMLGKTFKGLTDEMLRWQTAKLLELESSRDEWTVTVRPELVVEIAFSDLQESARYPAGLALRFARVKNYRPDKSPLEADTIQKVRAIFASQRA